MDFVVTWVDGSDPQLRQARTQAKAELGGKRKGRYADNGEIYYLVASIIKYAPFVRRVYIVTDNQTPPFLNDFVAAGLCTADMLRLVSHDVIFEGLDVPRPTFNSRVIEAALWRIPGLSEQFVYANDDMFLNAPLVEEDFFRGGKPVIHGSMRWPGGWVATAAMRRAKAFFKGKAATEIPLHGRAQERGAKLAGKRGRFLMAPHVPHPLRRSTFDAFHAERPDIVSAQLQHRFRHSSQYLPVSLSNHLEQQKHGVGFTRGWKVAYLTPKSSPSHLERGLAAIRNATVPLGCIQSLEKFSPERQARVHATLREKFAAELPMSLRN